MDNQSSLLDNTQPVKKKSRKRKIIIIIIIILAALILIYAGLLVVWNITRGNPLPFVGGDKFSLDFNFSQLDYQRSDCLEGLSTDPNLGSRTDETKGQVKTNYFDFSTTIISVCSPKPYLKLSQEENALYLNIIEYNTQESEKANIANMENEFPDVQDSGRFALCGCGFKFKGKINNIQKFDKIIIKSISDSTRPREEKIIKEFDFN